MQLLTKDPTRRLGATEADATEIKSHLFFKDTNWDDVFHKRIPSPFYPAIVRVPLFLSPRDNCSRLVRFLPHAEIRNRHVQL